MSGATIGYDCTETWGNQHTRLNLNGDNAGFLVDIYPVLQLSVGLQF